MNYQLILNNHLLEQFVHKLPELKADEKYMICLFARKKYDSTGTLKSDKAALKRVLSSKEHIIDKIKQMETALGTYKTKQGLSIPQESLAVYITPNPRSMERAAKDLLKTLADKVTQNYSDYNVSSLSLNAAQVSSGTKHFMDFDFDNVKYDKSHFEGVINHDAYTVIHTRGGFHLLVCHAKIAKEYSKSWYQKISSMPKCDVRGDCFLPVPGCTQGGFVPYFEGELF